MEIIRGFIMLASLGGVVIFYAVWASASIGERLMSNTNIFQHHGFPAILFVFVVVVVVISSIVIFAKGLKRRRAIWQPCPHGVQGGLVQRLCEKCGEERLATEEAARVAREAERRHREIAAKAAQVREQEAERLRKTIALSLDELRSLRPQKFEDQIAQMFERLGYSVEQTPYSNDHGRDAILWKGREKFLLECKRYGDSNQSGRPDLQKFHSAIVTDKAKRGFFVTSSGFSREAKAFAATEPIDLVDGPELVRLMFESRANAVQDDNYSSVCKECGDVVEHYLRSPKNIMCRHGHPVTPTLSINDLLVRSGGPPTCVRCGAPMRSINGKHGKFWGCTKYPECRYTRSFRL